MSRQDTDLHLAPIARELNECTVFQRVLAPRAYFVDLADLHEAARHQNSAALRKMISTIAQTDNMFVVIGGDSTENATLAKGSSSPYEEKHHGYDQVRSLKEKLEPIKDKILLVRSGNHGAGRAKKLDNMVPEEVLADLLGVKYCAGFAAVIINVNKNMYTIALQHNNKLPQHFEWLHSDITFFEHRHANGYKRSLIAGVNGFTKTWTVREHLDIQAGSFLSWGGYAKEAGYKPLHTGCPIVELSGETNKWEMRVHEKIEHFVELAEARGDIKKQELTTQTLDDIIEALDALEDLTE